jgi:hypothetical protein
MEKGILQLIQIIRPLLHHLPALWQILNAVVSGPIRVLDDMGKLVLNEVRAELKELIKDRPRHGPETMACFIPFPRSDIPDIVLP